VAASLVVAPFEWMADGLGGLAGWVFQQVWNVFDQTTLVDVTNPAYTMVYAILFGVACMVMLIFFCFQLITGLVRHEPGALGRALTGLAKAVIGSFLILTVTGLLLHAVDQISLGIIAATGNTITTMGTRLGAMVGGVTILTGISPGAGVLLALFLGMLLVTSALIVWFSLLIRKALLLIALVFGPFAMAGLSWDATRGWLSKWASFVIAMILSKLVLVTILLIGVSLAGSPLEPDLQAISEPVTGVVLLLIATFAPYMAYKFIAFMGSDMYHLMSAETEAKSALNRPIPIKPTPSQPPTTLGSPTFGGGTPAPSSPTPTPASTSSAGTTSASTGTSSSTSAGAAGGSAAAGPAAAVTIGTQVVTAGPKTGAAIGAQANQATPPSTLTMFTPTSSSPPPAPPAAAVN